VSVTLKRHGKLEVVLLEQRTGVDDQGKPAFNSPVALEGRVVREQEVVRTGVGADVKIVADVWLDGAQSPLPTTDDRVELEDGLVGIVVFRNDGRNVQSQLDHVSLRLRQE
jgi:hypothetical protein